MRTSGWLADQKPSGIALLLLLKVQPLRRTITIGQGAHSFAALSLNNILKAEYSLRGMPVIHRQKDMDIVLVSHRRKFL